ncbi:hypothetical protein [Lacticaseibacillus jixiensis]|uniref:hypothetical protein n=1 Tax=Lacticaseibacillus jixiensis TaxID=3231926 RepID=UPI0036F341FB
MMIWVMIAILLLIAAIAGGLLWRDEQQVIDLVQTTHKTMFAQQIRAARRVYLRGVYRNHPHQHRLRAWAIGLGVFSVALIALAVAIQLQGGFVDAAAEQLLRNLALTTAAIALVVASYLAWVVAAWTQRFLTEANAQGDPTDLYFTPLDHVQRRFQYQRVITISVAIAALLIGVAGWTDQLPELHQPARQSAAPTQVPAASASSAGADQTQTPASSSSAASSSSWQRSVPGTEYPIDAMKEAALAPASSLKQLTTADLAALYFAEYWTLNGLQLSEIAEYAASGSYSYQVVADSEQVLTAGDTLMVFNDASSGKTQHMFYALRNGDTVSFQKMYNATDTLYRLSEQYGLRVVNGHAVPSGAEIKDSREPLRQLVTAFYSDKAFAAIKQGVKREADVPF